MKTVFVADETVLNAISSSQRSLETRLHEESNDFTNVLIAEKNNRKLLRMIILLIGDFAADEKGNKHQSPNPWINDNCESIVEGERGGARRLIGGHNNAQWLLIASCIVL
jgi:hypothetical protein